MVKRNKTCVPQVLKACENAVKCLVLYDQHSKTQEYLFYNAIQETGTFIPHV